MPVHPVIRHYLSQIGRKGGKAKSQNKRLAARANGKKGGRPTTANRTCDKV